MKNTKPKFYMTWFFDWDTLTSKQEWFAWQVVNGKPIRVYGRNPSHVLKRLKSKHARKYWEITHNRNTWRAGPAQWLWDKTLGPKEKP